MMCRLAIVLVLVGVTVFDAAVRAEDGSFDAKGVKIHYIAEGKGEPVVLIHGLGSSAMMNWQLPGIVTALAKDHRVIALDMPGHGRSDKPDNDEAYGTQMAEDVVLLMDHLKIKKAHIVGYSMGGMIAGKLMSKHPDRVISCILGGMGWMKEGSPLAQFWEKMPARGGAWNEGAASRPAAGRPMLGGGSTPLACVHGMTKLAISEEELKGINLPVLVLVGERDPVKRLYVEPLQQVRKDWPVIVIPGAGHLNCVINKQFKDEITKWVGQNSGK